jgi:hypothetical protein
MKTLVQPSTPGRTSLSPAAALSPIPENGVLGGPRSIIIEIRGKKVALPEANLRPLTPLNYGQVAGNTPIIPQVPSGRYPDVEPSVDMNADFHGSDVPVRSTGVGKASTDAEKESTSSKYPSLPLLDPAALEAAVKAIPDIGHKEPPPKPPPPGKSSRRKPGARECIQMSRRFGPNIIPERQMRLLLDYCTRGKVEHLIRMRERLDEHSRFLEHQLAGLEVLVQQRGESDLVVAPVPQKQKSIVTSSTTTASTTATTSKDDKILARSPDPKPSPEA